MAKRFKKGKVFTSITDLLQAIDAGQWVYWGDRPKHPQIINNMPIMAVRVALRVGILCEAIDTWK